MARRRFWIYIVASRGRVLYTGFINDLDKRVWEHKNKAIPGFTAKYNINHLVYFEEYTDAITAIDREKQIKRWRREKKVALIEAMNPGWDDMARDWFTQESMTTETGIPPLRSAPVGMTGSGSKLHKR